LKFKGQLYPYQKEGLDFALATGFSINGFTMGLGKTAVGLALACKTKSHTTVVAPAFLVENWKREIQKFTVNAEKHIEVMSYNAFSKLGHLDTELLIFDEAHYLKTPSAKRTEKAHILLETSPPKGLLLLSGTPVKNRVPEFYSLLRLIWLGGYYPEFDAYANSYRHFCKTFSNEFTQRTPYGFVTKFEGLRNPQKLRELIAPIYLRRRAEDVLDLPKQVFKEVVTRSRWKEDLKLENAWFAYNGGDKKHDFSSAKAVNALSKVEYTVELAQEIMSQGQRVVVFSDHVKACEAIANEIGVPAITGATPATRRLAFVDEFAKREGSALVCSIGAMSTGLNLTCASYMVFNDYPWVPAELQQAEKRIHRIGQSSTCFYYYILSSEVDAYILRILKSKTKTLDEVVG